MSIEPTSHYECFARHPVDVAIKRSSLAKRSVIIGVVTTGILAGVLFGTMHGAISAKLIVAGLSGTGVGTFCYLCSRNHQSYNEDAPIQMSSLNLSELIIEEAI